MQELSTLRKVRSRLSERWILLSGRLVLALNALDVASYFFTQASLLLHPNVYQLISSLGVVRPNAACRTVRTVRTLISMFLT